MASHDVVTLTSSRSVFRGVLFALLTMSFVINILSLTGSFYMLQVYDRVLTSQNISTLVALSLLAALLFGFQMLVEIFRGRVMRRVGDRADRILMPAAHELSARMPLYGVTGADALQPIRDVDTIRAFLIGQGPIAIFDLPWLPVFLLFATALHPVFGLMTAGGALVLVALTLLSERVMRDRGAHLIRLSSRRQAVADENTRNAEAALAMGFDKRMRDRFIAQGEMLMEASAKATDSGSALASLSRVFRVMLQSGVLGVGAYLTIKGQVTGGAMVAASIISARALSPVELAIGHWRQFAQARQARRRLSEMLERDARPQGAPTVLPKPKASLSLDKVSVVAPGGQRVVDSVSFELTAGQGLGIVGASAAGKSSLARAIMGIWPAAAGTVRVDGATLKQWEGGDLGRYIGFMPQDVQLFDGTIAENISRFEETPDSTAVIDAAKAANVHAMILKLPKGYDTPIGNGGSHLSAGQRQRIALARALYRDPFLVVLDEPNSNLDGDGEAALIEAIKSTRARGGIVIMIAHRASSLAAVDTVAVMSGGRMTMFGPRDEVMRKVVRANQPSQANPQSTPLQQTGPAGGGFTVLTRGIDGGSR